MISSLKKPKKTFKSESWVSLFGPLGRRLLGKKLPQKHESENQTPYIDPPLRLGERITMYE